MVSWMAIITSERISWWPPPGLSESASHIRERPGLHDLNSRLRSRTVRLQGPDHAGQSSAFSPEGMQDMDSVGECRNVGPPESSARLTEPDFPNAAPIVWIGFQSTGRAPFAPIQFLAGLLARVRRENRANGPANPHGMPPVEWHRWTIS